MSGVARRYAVAAVEAAREQGGEEAIKSMAEGLRTFANAYAESADLQELVNNPAFERERAETLQRVGEALELPPLVRSAVLAINNNERMGIIEEIAAEVEEVADQELGRARAHVTSAIELSDAKRQRLVKALEKRLSRPVILDLNIDPAILGGLVVKVGSVTIDSSIRRQLEVLSERLHSES